MKLLPKHLLLALLPTLITVAVVLVVSRGFVRQILYDRTERSANLRARIAALDLAAIPKKTNGRPSPVSIATPEQHRLIVLTDEGRTVLDQGPTSSAVIRGQARVPGRPWTVFYEVARADVHHEMRSLMLAPTIGMITGASLIVLLIGFMVSRRLTGPIVALRGAHEALAAGDMAIRADAASPDEIGDLARAFNAMADRLQASEALYRNLLENTPLPIFVHADDRILYLNGAAKMLAGVNALGSPIDAFVTEESAPGLRRLFSSKHATAVTLKNQETLVLESTGLEVEFEGTDARLVVLTDVSQQHQREGEKSRLEERVRHAQKLESLGLVAGGIAHDFNNMLTAIMGNSELVLLETPEDAPARGPLEQVRKATQKASELTRQMLAYAGRGQFVLGSVDLQLLVDEVQELLRSSISKKVSLEIERSDEQIYVEADSTQIQQVVMNLITNANEAMAEMAGTITVSTSSVLVDDSTNLTTLEGLPKGEYAMIEVRDTGVGMDDETRVRIFDPFFTTKMTGRGLGLAGVLGIVRAHLGDLSVETAPGEGTTFRIYLPKTDRIPESSDDIMIDESPFYGSGTILVADDEEPVRALTKRILERYGFEVIPAANGQEALEQFEARKQDIVCALVDLAMPELSGLEVLEQIRERSEELPVVLMSGYDDAGNSTPRPGDLRVTFVGKPFGVSPLIDAIKKATAYEA